MNPAAMLLLWLAPILCPSRIPVGLGDPDWETGTCQASTAGGAASGLTFTANRGQWPDGPCFVGRSGSLAVGAVPGSVRLQLPEVHGDFSRGLVVALTFEGSTGKNLVGVDPAPGLHSYFQGDDPSRWVTGARSFHRVLYESLYEGVDLLLRAGPAGAAYDLRIAPGADLGQVVVRCDGIDGLTIDENGRLSMRTPIGELHQAPATCWEETGAGEARPVEVAFRAIDEHRFGFVVPARAPSATLVIDPDLVWSTFLGGAAGGGSAVGDFLRAVALDGNGHITVVGTSEGPGFPMTEGAYQFPDFFFEDVSVTKLRQADGKLIYSSLIGGFSHIDEAHDVAVDATGNATVVGWTSSGDFPTTPGAFDTTMNGLRTAFVLRLSSSGQQLEYSTFLEGSNGSKAYAVDLALDGSAVVGGEAFSNDFPTTPGAYQTTYTPSSFSNVEAFVTRLNRSGSGLVWSTFLGGNGSDSPQALVLDELERVVVVGTTDSPTFPTTPGAFMETTMTSSAFASRLSSDGSSLEWSTYLGSPSSPFGNQNPTIGLTVALDRSGSVLVGGQTRALDFPVTPGVFGPTHFGGAWDGFVSKFDPTGSSLEYSTYLGSVGGLDEIRGVCIDQSGVATIAGSVNSLFGFPTTPGALQSGTGEDAILARFDPAASRLYYCTRVGGSFLDMTDGLVVSPFGRATFVGSTFSPDYPTTPGSMSPTYNGGQRDGIVTTMDLCLQGIDLAGVSTPSCLGAVNANATTMPLAGQPFGLYCSQAPPGAKGLLLTFSGEALASIVPVQADSNGFLETSLGSLPNTPGKVLRCRYVFRNTPTCSGPALVSTSNWVVIQVQ